MAKLRLLLLFLTIFVVGTLGTLTFLFAKGYRFDSDKGTVGPSGLLVIKSNPDGAQVFINGELKGATNTTMSLAPGIYDVKVSKESYTKWSKRLEIQKEIVTEATAHLFKTTLSLTSITGDGVKNPSISPDLSKIAYIITDSTTNTEKSGLWILENINLPLGFSRDPKRVTDGDLTNATWIWSPTSREILLETLGGSYLLDTSKFTQQRQLVNITSTKNEILNKWQTEASEKTQSQLKVLPETLTELISESSSSIVFSPDEDMVLYKANKDYDIPNELIKPFPGASTQKQERHIKSGQTYVYDIREDRNFLVDSDNETQIVGTWSNKPVVSERSLVWYPSSRQLILSEKDNITIMDYDGTNHQVVYSGSYVAPHTFPTYSLDKILILTNLGATEVLPNLYSLTIK